MCQKDCENCEKKTSGNCNCSKKRLTQAFVRRSLNEYFKENISFGKLVEILNEEVNQPSVVNKKLEEKQYSINSLSLQNWNEVFSIGSPIIARTTSGEKIFTITHNWKETPVGEYVTLGVLDEEVEGENNLTNEPVLLSTFKANGIVKKETITEYTML